MINNLKYIKHISTSVLMVSVFMMSIFMTSCEFDLPEANSIPDATPPSADFGSSVGDEYTIINFANFSVSATDYSWDFGDGSTSTSKDVQHVYAESSTDSVGTPYTVTLTVADKLLVTSTTTQQVIVLKPEAPPALDPTIFNGDFSDGTSEWKIAAFTGGTTNPFNASSDGSSLNYDGKESGGSKTPGAKWTSSTSAGPSVSSSTRYAYQEILVTPNTDYFIEFEYAIKTDKEDIEGGDRVIGEVLDGWFADGVDAVASSEAGPIVQVVGDVANGKGNFDKPVVVFTSNDSGKISLWLYAITKDELYVDNVKVYPVE